MNDSELRINSENNNTYHATANLNTAIENPQVNINSAMGVNIQNTEENNYNGVENSSYNISQNLNDNNNFNNNINVNNNYNVNQNQFSGNIGMNNNQFINIQDSYTSDNSINVSNNNYQTENTNSEFNSQFVSGADSSVGDNNGGNSISDVQNTSNVTYEPTLKEKKKPSDGLQVPKEFKVMVLIVGCLLLFIFVIPYVYDFFRELQLVITTG